MSASPVSYMIPPTSQLFVRKREQWIWALLLLSLASQFPPLLLPSFWSEYYWLSAIWSLLELGFMVLLILNTLLFWRWAKQNHWPNRVQWTALACVVSLCFCLMGDVVNKNFLQSFYFYDHQVKHSYLISSIALFFPAYLLLLLTVLKACSSRLNPLALVVFTLSSLVIGLLSYTQIRHPDMASGVLLVLAAYSVLITAVGLAGVVAWLAGGQRIMIWAAIGLSLAALADALIGQFWIKTDVYYPSIRYLNWMIYFSSQALIQFFPLRLLVSERLSGHKRPEAQS